MDNWTERDRGELPRTVHQLDKMGVRNADAGAQPGQLRGSIVDLLGRWYFQAPALGAGP
jgi:hypothetical protein